jgi:hypothetical protein
MCIGLHRNRQRIIFGEEHYKFPHCEILSCPLSLPPSEFSTSHSDSCSQTNSIYDGFGVTTYFTMKILYSGMLGRVVWYKFTSISETHNRFNLYGPPWLLDRLQPWRWRFVWKVSEALSECTASHTKYMFSCTYRDNKYWRTCSRSRYLCRCKSSRIPQPGRLLCGEATSPWLVDRPPEEALGGASRWRMEVWAYDFAVLIRRVRSTSHIWDIPQLHVLLYVYCVCFLRPHVTQVELSTWRTNTWTGAYWTVTSFNTRSGSSTE